ncbi:MAG: adenosine kinase [Alphaproteobacteria bacterium]
MSFDVTSIGRVLMDVIDYVPHNFLEKYNLIQGQGNVLTVDILKQIKDELPEPKLFAGGAAGNSTEGIASLGGKAAFFGKGCSDNMGQAYKKAFTDKGVLYATKLMEPDASANQATGRCIVLVTPDTDRTFALTLGVCEHLIPEDIDETIIKDSKVLFIEGQMLVAESAREAVLKAIDIALKNEIKIAFNMHDLNFREHRVIDILPVIRDKSNILIGNEREIRSCFDLNENDDVNDLLSHRKQILAMTKGGRGAVILNDEKQFFIPSENKKRIVDSTGAGDQFAAGLLFGIARGYSLDKAGRLAATAAAEVLQHWGGRPETDLSQFVN